MPKRLPDELRQNWLIKKFNHYDSKLQLEENIKQRIFFNGQIYDAYSLIIDIIKKEIQIQ